MSAVEYDEKSFEVDGRRIWIVSGAVHYFRVPRGLWRDRLVKLKRAGCNTVETYVAWNVHERTEGRFDFSGEADFEAFLELAEELGLWIIVRPGPYICAEWDNGGIPAWVNAKGGVRLREAGSVHHGLVERWFEQLIPIVARHQVTHGGRVILVQDENEYCFRNRPGGREHLVFLRDLLRRLGIDVPIIVCNFLYERISGTIECWNCWDEPARGIETLRRAQKDTPKLVTEFWPGWFESWGHGELLPRKTPRDVHSRSMEILAHGGMYSYYMFHGGTNFGHYPGRTQGDDHVYMISSYDYDAPLSEAGGLTEKYYAAKLASAFASNMEDFLAESEPARLPVRSADDVEIIVRKSPGGHVIFVFNRSQRKTAHLKLPGGVALEVSFRDLDAVALPYRYSPVGGFTIDYSNLSLLGKMPMGVGRMVFLYGPRGTQAVLSAQGRRFRRKVGGEAQLWLGHFPNLVALVDTRQAERTWFLDDRTVVGGDYVGEACGDEVEVTCRRQRRVISYFPTGKVNYTSCTGRAEPQKLPKLGGWKKRALLPAGRPPGARRVDAKDGAFVPLEEIGYCGGYGWYYTRIEAARAGTGRLLFTDAEDRLTVFVNGRRAGTFGRGAGASTNLVDCQLKKGPNDLHVLLDNLGRANFSLALGELKGIRSGVYLGARRLRPTMAWTAGKYNGKLAKTWQMETFWPHSKGVEATLSVVFGVKEGEGAAVRIEGPGEPAAVFVNRKFHSYYWGRCVLNRANLVLTPGELSPGKNLVELAFMDKPNRKGAQQAVSVYAFDRMRALDGPWYFAPCLAPSAKGAVKKMHRETPAAWETTFELKKPSGAIFLVTDGLKKGEVWLNGRMVSRHWNIGPQKKAYLPEPWLKRKNKLIIVDEFGTRPSRVHLTHDELTLMHHEVV